MAIFKLPWGVAILTGQSLHFVLAYCRNLNVCKKIDLLNLFFGKIRLRLACWRFINFVTALMAKVLLLGNPNQWYPIGTGFMAVINSLWLTANFRQAGCLKNGATRTRYHTKLKRR